MLTSLGTFLRKIRINKGEILRDMATNLGVSSAFLSAVENGKKKNARNMVAEIGGGLLSFCRTNVGIA